MTFGWTEMIGVVDLRSLGFYKIKQEALQEHLGRHYHFEFADDICNQYNRCLNLMRKEEENSKGKFPWLEDTNERKHMTDREILDKYVNLDNSCLETYYTSTKMCLVLETREDYALTSKLKLMSLTSTHSSLDHFMPMKKIK